MMYLLIDHSQSRISPSTMLLKAKEMYKQFRVCFMCMGQCLIMQYMILLIEFRPDNCQNRHSHLRNGYSSFKSFKDVVLSTLSIYQMLNERFILWYDGSTFHFLYT